jgi:hypothetical protein
MNYIINQIDDHEYYYDLFIKNLKHVSEDQFTEVWKNCNSKSINNLKKNKIIQIALKEFIYYSNFKNVLDIFFGKNITIKWYQGWINRYANGEFQEFHSHLDKDRDNTNLYSFVYFLDIPKNSHCFNFCDGVGNNKKYINEKSGDLLIFDNALHHSVDKNNSDQYRYTLAGNIKIE